jgi:hypothetical protein
MTTETTTAAADSEERPKKKPWIEGLTAEMVEKQLEFYTTRVKHPAMQKLLDDLMPLLMPHSESNIVVVTGATGAGKSTLTRVLLKSLFDDFAQLMQDDPAVIPLISVEAYANGDTRHGFKGLYKSMLHQLAEPGTEQKAPVTLVDGKLTVHPSSKHTIDGLRHIVESGLRQRRTRVGVIDEAAHLLRFAKESVVMDTLKSLSNTTGTKWLLVGSFDLFDLIVEDSQVARRANILNLERYHLDVARDRKTFEEIVGKLQAKWPSEEVPNFVAISDALLEASLGCIGLLKSLMLDASAMQLRNNGKWNPAFLKKAAKSNKIHDVIRREIEIGEEKVRDALYGNSIWDDATFSKLVHQMGASKRG